MQIEVENNEEKLQKNSQSLNKCETFSEIFGRSEQNSSTSHKTQAQAQAQLQPQMQVEELEIKIVDVKKERLLQRGLRSLYSNFDRSAPKIRESESKRQYQLENNHFRVGLDRPPISLGTSLKNSDINERLRSLRQSSTYTTRSCKNSSVEIENSNSEVLPQQGQMFNLNLPIKETYNQTINFHLIIFFLIKISECSCSNYAHQGFKLSIDGKFGLRDIKTNFEI